MSARTRPPSTEQHLSIIVELDRLQDTASRLIAAQPSDLIRKFVRITVGRAVRLPPPTTTTEANLRIEHLRHYNRHSYRAEKLAALTAWQLWLDTKTS